MRTLIIRIGRRTGKQRPHIPVALFGDHQGDGWRDASIIKSKWPTSLEYEPGKSVDFEAALALMDNRGQSPAFKEIGRQLFALLTSGEVGEAWKTSFDECWGPSPKEGLRTALDIQDPELRALPWEVLAKGDIALFANHRNPWVRGSWPADSHTAPLLTPPLIVLIVVAAKDDETSRIDEELHGLSRSCARFDGMVEPIILRYPTKREISIQIERWKPNIFHFAGHGYRDETGGLSLQLYDPQRDENGLVPVGDILNWFNAWTPQVVFLNACRTGETNPDLRREISDLRSQLLSVGVRATVAMQGSIDTSAAVTLANEVLSRVSERQPLDSAIAGGREAVMAMEHQGGDYRDAYLPVLETSVPPEHVIALHEAHFLHAAGYEQLTSFVDRAKQRWEFVGLDHDWLQCQTPRKRYAAAVIGDKGIGKTEIIRWGLRSFALRGHYIRYVSFSPEEGRTKQANLYDVLSTIAGTKQPWEQDRPADTDLYELASLDPDGDLSYLEDPSRGSFSDVSNDINALCTKLLDGLERDAKEAGKCRLLVIDGLEGIHTSAFHYIAKYVVGPVAEGQRQHLRIALGVRDTERERLKATPGLLEVEVPALERALWMPLAKQFFAQLDIPEDDWLVYVEEMERGMERKDRKTWAPKKLHDVHRLFL